MCTLAKLLTARVGHVHTSGQEYNCTKIAAANIQSQVNVQPGRRYLGVASEKLEFRRLGGMKACAQV